MTNPFKKALETSSSNDVLEKELKAKWKIGADLRATEVIELISLLDIGTRYSVDIKHKPEESIFTGHTASWVISDDEDRTLFNKQIKSKDCVKVVIFRQNKNDLKLERVDNRYRIVSI